MMLLTLSFNISMGYINQDYKEPHKVMAGKPNFDPTRALNPGKVTRTRQHIKEYAKAYCEDMINVLYDIAQDDTAYARDRIAAAEAILNRGYGKPVDSNKIEEDLGNVIHVEKLTSAQLMNILSECSQSDMQDMQSLPPPTIEQQTIEAVNAEFRDADE